MGFSSSNFGNALLLDGLSLTFNSQGEAQVSGTYTTQNLVFSNGVVVTSGQGAPTGGITTYQTFDTGNYQSTWDSGKIFAQQITASESGTVQQVALQFTAPVSSTAHVNIAIYSDSSGSPDSLLASTGSVLLTAANLNSANASLNTAVSITKNTNYWIAFQVDSDTPINAASGGGFTNYYYTSTYTSFEQTPTWTSDSSLPLFGGQIVFLSGTEVTGSYYLRVDQPQVLYVYDGSNWLVSHSVDNITSLSSGSPYSVATTDQVLLITTGSSSFTVDLPTVSGVTGRKILIIKADSGSGSIIIDPNGSDTIEGSTSKTISSQYGKVAVISDGSSTWYDLGTGGGI